MTADEVKKLLGLRPHPREGGFFVRTYEAVEMVALPRYAGDGRAGERRTGTAIYYLLEPGTFSEMHRLRSDEVFHFYAGDAVEMLQLEEGHAGRMVAIGNDLAAGERPQAVVPAHAWQAAQSLGDWTLCGCTVAPGFDFKGFELAPPHWVP